MNRLLATLILAAAGFALSPATASAQFGPGYPRNPYMPNIAPSFNPFYYVPQYRYQSGFSLNVPTPFGYSNISTYRYSYGVTPAAALAPFAPTYPSFYSQGGSYTTGSTGARPNFALQAQRDLANAQQAMARERSLTGGTGSGGTGTGAKVEVGGPMPDGFGKALEPADRAEVLSGEALNELLAAVVKAEVKGGNRPSAFVPALLLDNMRFGGTPAADALNLSRGADKLKFPAAFDDAALKDLRDELDANFTAVATAVQGGKAPDPAKRAQLEVTLRRTETALAPVIKNLPFEDATDARRFMNQMNSAMKAFKSGAATGVIDPKWATEGTTVADLAKHMTRHKLQFAAAPTGNEDSYTTMHRNFATYLFALTQPKK